LSARGPAGGQDLTPQRARKGGAHGAGSAEAGALSKRWQKPMRLRIRPCGRRRLRTRGPTEVLRLYAVPRRVLVANRGSPSLDKLAMLQCLSVRGGANARPQEYTGAVPARRYMWSIGFTEGRS
jgi:hypothetical protein